MVNLECKLPPPFIQLTLSDKTNLSQATIAAADAASTAQETTRKVYPVSVAATVIVRANAVGWIIKLKSLDLSPSPSPPKTPP